MKTTVLKFFRYKSMQQMSSIFSHPDGVYNLHYALNKTTSGTENTKLYAFAVSDHSRKMQYRSIQTWYVANVVIPEKCIAERLEGYKIALFICEAEVAEIETVPQYIAAISEDVATETKWYQTAWKSTMLAPQTYKQIVYAQWVTPLRLVFLTDPFLYLETEDGGKIKREHQKLKSVLYQLLKKGEI